MGGSVMIVGPYRRHVHDLFEPLWSELELEQHRFTSTSAALEVIHNGTRPSAILVSHPLWDSSLDDLLAVLGRALPTDRTPPLVVMTPESSTLELAGLEERGITVLSEDREAEELRQHVRDLLGATRRAHPRFMVRMAVEVESGAVLRACQSEDISFSGMLIRTSEEFPVGSQVDLDFSLPDEDEPIRCKAEVVRSTHLKSSSVGAIGVHFLSFVDDGKQRLERFLSARGQSSKGVETPFDPESKTG